MANLYRSERKAAEAANFRFIPNIDSLDETQLNKAGYYRGFTCAHNHTIRDQENHWCYHCVHKIQSNICGFDINYINVEYKAKYHKLWKKVAIDSPDVCWTIDAPGPYAPKRVCMPSYRSAYSHQKAENLSFHKALYTCAWGDVGAMVVTRTCGNPKCGNPLHLISSWNKILPPSQVHPIELEFQVEKLMSYGNNKNQPTAFNQIFRNAIVPPKELETADE